MERIFSGLLSLTLIAIVLSPTIAGVCARAVLTLPLIWSGVSISPEAIINFHF